MLWEAFLITKRCRFRISKPFSNRSKFENFRSAHAPTVFERSFFSVTLRIQKFLSIHFWSLSDPVSENRVRFDRSIKKYFHFRQKSLEK